MTNQTLSIVNIGIQIFYESLINQNCHCLQLQWLPPYEQPKDIEILLDDFL